MTQIDRVSGVLRNAEQTLRRYKKEALHRLDLCWEAFVRPVPRRTKLLILDDFFPNLKTGFRLAEFHYLHRHYQDVIILSSYKVPLSNRLPFRKKASFAPVWKIYNSLYSRYAQDVYPYNRFRKIEADLAYLIFINNAYNFLEYLECTRIPFVFTLYPGGGFLLNNPESDRKLKKVLSSQLCRGVIVSQDITKNYLLEKGLCHEEMIHFQYGVVIDSDRYDNTANIPGNNTTINICFVAFKYMDKGLDKGYDIFIECCRYLHKQGSFRFHVVGNFSYDDIDVAEFGESIQFYGPLFDSQLEQFFRRMDIILAPNRALTLAPGAFDGFPTGCCVEAALCGVAVFSSDPMNQNRPFIDGEHLVLIDLDPIEIAAKIIAYTTDPERLVQLRRSGQERFSAIYAIEHQMRTRIEAIDSAMSKPRAAI